MKTEITLHDPTPLLLSAFRFKQLTFKDGGARDVLLEVSGPALRFQHHVIVGEAAILGWLERRYPYPGLFPASIELYARASTLAHALTTDPVPAADALWTSMQYRPHSFLTGAHPNIADVALASILDRWDTVDDAQNAYIESVYAFAKEVYEERRAECRPPTGASAPADCEELWA